MDWIKAGIDYQVNGDLENKLAHILNLRFPGAASDLLLMKLDLQGIAVSTGSACTAGNVEPSHVLEAMYGEIHGCSKRIDSCQLWLWYNKRTRGAVY
jgi:cysteine sulfinate desulfinase/cysteine desulfurase-like protein